MAEYKRKTTTPQKPKTVKMTRESDGKTADVHPDMVADYRKGGYVENSK